MPSIKVLLRVERLSSKSEGCHKDNGTNLFSVPPGSNRQDDRFKEHKEEEEGGDLYIFLKNKIFLMVQTIQ